MENLNLEKEIEQIEGAQQVWDEGHLVKHRHIEPEGKLLPLRPFRAIATFMMGIESILFAGSFVHWGPY